MKKPVTTLSRRRRGSRSARAPYAGTSTRRSKRLSRGDVALDHGPFVREDERLSNYFEHVVGAQQEEHIEREKEGRHSLPGSNIGEQPEALDPAAWLDPRWT